MAKLCRWIGHYQRGGWVRKYSCLFFICYWSLLASMLDFKLGCFEVFAKQKPSRGSFLWYFYIYDWRRKFSFITALCFDYSPQSLLDVFIFAPSPHSLVNCVLERIGFRFPAYYSLQHLPFRCICTSLGANLFIPQIVFCCSQSQLSSFPSPLSIFLPHCPCFSPKKQLANHMISR